MPLKKQSQVVQTQRKGFLIAGLVIVLISAGLCLLFSTYIIGNPRMEQQWLYIIGVDVLGAFVCAAVYFGCIGNFKEGVDESTGIFAAMLLVNSLLFLFEELSWFAQGVASLRFLNITASVFTNCGDLLIIYLYWRYVRKALDLKGKLVKVADYIIGITIIPLLGLCLANFFVPIYFAVDAFGVYSRAKFFFLGGAYLFLVLIFILISIFRAKVPRSQKIVVIAFVAIPVAHYVISGDAFGTTTQYGAVLISILLMYCLVFLRRSRKLATTSSELLMANQIQEGMLPRKFPPFPERKEIDLYASMTPAKEVGGDFYDYFFIDDDHLCLLIADVSGKGIPASLFMMASKIVLANNASKDRSPAQILEKANDYISKDNTAEMFVTVWLGILELSTGILKAANAGHENPVITNQAGEFELFKDKHGFVIGGLEDMKYTDYELKLRPGSKIFVYTDGVTEATDQFGRMYGTDRLVNDINQYKDEKPQIILEGIKQSIDKFVGSADQFDDLTMLCIEYTGERS